MQGIGRTEGHQFLLQQTMGRGLERGKGDGSDEFRGGVGGRHAATTALGICTPGG